MAETVVEMKMALRELPKDCVKCSVLFAKEYCGLALFKRYYLQVMGTEIIPQGCVNKLGGLNAEQIGELKLI